MSDGIQTTARPWSGFLQLELSQTTGTQQLDESSFELPFKLTAIALVLFP